MVHLPASEARERLAHILNEVAYGHERYVLERHGKPVAVVISVDDFALLEELEDRIDVAAAKAALAEGGETEDWDEAKKELGL